MAEFENINSPVEGHWLEKQIQLAVAAAVEPLLCTGGWRVYGGPCQERLVRELATTIGTAHVGLTCSGSAALEVVLRACRLGVGDEVLLSAYDYPGNFTAIESCGGWPVLVDVAPDSWNLSLESLEAVWTPTCKVLVVSHLHGQLQDMQALQAWCGHRGVCLIQDACQALGATIAGQPLGIWADATIFSFGGSKVLSAGRGGAWCTNSDSLAQHARVAAGVGSGAYELSEIQASMVWAQLPYLNRITRACREYFGKQLELMAPVQGLHAPWAAQLNSTAFYQAGWLLPNGDLQDSLLAKSNEATARALEEAGQGFSGFHRRSSRRCRKPAHLENAVQVAARTRTFHHRPALRTTRP